jgi:CBS domain-containing protein
MLCPSCGYENIEGTDRCDNCLTPFRDLDIPNPHTTEGLARSVMEDNLRLLEPDNSIIVSPDIAASDVVTRMKASLSGCALVVQGGKLVGIFTEHDVLKNLNDVKTPQGTLVGKLMSPNPEVLNESDTVATALNKMSLGRYRHIPVQKADGGFVVASISSVLKYIAREDW